MASDNVTTSSSVQENILRISQALYMQSDIPGLLHTLIRHPALPYLPAALELRLPHVRWHCSADGNVAKQDNLFSTAQDEPKDAVIQNLTVNGNVLGRLLFIPSAQKLFTDSAKLWFSQLCTPVAALLQHLLTQEALQNECRQLRDERDHFRILVDTTNSVISHLDMHALVSEVSKEIHRFFGIDYIGMALLDADSRHARFDLYSTWYAPGAPLVCEREYIAMQDTLLAQSGAQPQLCVMQLNNEDKKVREDGLLTRATRNGLNNVCLLPLQFGHEPQGVLILAHRSGGMFQGSHLHLLQQIAARISIAVDNASAYSVINRLKETLEIENIWLNEQIGGEEHFSEIIYQSQAMKEVLTQIEMVAQSDCTVLILGETGTGKELVARAIHNLSQRKGHRMVKMNCAAIPATLIESDLFGHEKGAFTGATSTHIGRFERAEGGSLFLDEVGDMPLELQPKLLRVLQEREIERLGSNRVIPVNVRLIAATNQDLHQKSLDREFRSDLYYRLNVFPILIPPLRERPEDIPLLAKHFTQKISRRMNRTIDSISAEGMRLLSQLPWPGNVRELENVIERAVILSQGNTLHLPLEKLRHYLPAEPPAPVRTPRAAPAMITPPVPEHDDAERERIIQVLRETNGIVAGPRGAAARLGLKRSTLLSRMQRLGISAREI
ncbi:sigma 54-interacting transcriptional regulator [Atlantibacter sp.]|uniref:sigma 54-interacting transcriptional regulator n=1 Tax=Atlantibacter sp. TaxID=1903473 RepID=UPI0028B11612|nr:sigma 54-interacting transcriptional regulator [Atlantibacter sp.]